MVNETKPSDVPNECPSCGSTRMFWTMTDILCLMCRWSARRQRAR